jgi:hypothetical protein
MVPDQLAQLRSSLQRTTTTMFTFPKRATRHSGTRAKDDRSATQFVPTQTGELNNVDLIHLAISETMQRHKIPKDWIDVELLEIQPRLHKDEIVVHLTMRRWSEQLLRHMAALEQQFRAGLDYFDPGIDHTHYVIAWKFSKDCELPFAAIPDNVTWHVSALRQHAN